MRKRRFSRFLLVSVVTFSLVASLIFFLLAYTGYLSNVTDSVSYAISSPVSRTKSFFSDFFTVNDLRREISDLKEKNALLEQKADSIDSLVAENESLRASLELNDKLFDERVLTGQVINRSTVSWLDWVTVNIGKNKEVSDQMLVLSDGYLVGVIFKVSKWSSRVELLTNTGNTTVIPVQISVGSKNVYGILSGFNQEKGAFVVTNLNKNIEIPEGSMVRTSHLDGKTVENLKVGQVLTVSQDDLNKTVFVKPGADFDQLSYLTLVGANDEEN